MTEIVATFALVAIAAALAFQTWHNLTMERRQRRWASEQAATLAKALLDAEKARDEAEAARFLLHKFDPKVN